MATDSPLPEATCVILAIAPDDARLQARTPGQSGLVVEDALARSENGLVTLTPDARVAVPETVLQGFPPKTRLILQFPRPSGDEGDSRFLAALRGRKERFEMLSAKYDDAHAVGDAEGEKAAQESREALVRAIVAPLGGSVISRRIRLGTERIEEVSPGIFLIDLTGSSKRSG